MRIGLYYSCISIPRSFYDSDGVGLLVAHFLSVLNSRLVGFPQIADGGDFPLEGSSTKTYFIRLLDPST